MLLYTTLPVLFINDLLKGVVTCSDYWFTVPRLKRIFLLLLLLLLFITFIQGTYNYVPETNHASRAYNVAGILWLKRFTSFYYLCYYYVILIILNITKQTTNSVALVRTRTIPTERPPPVGEVSANFCG